MARSYAENIGTLSSAAEKGTLPSSPSLHWCEDNKGRRFFRFDLDLPALFVVSEPVSRFKAYRQYVIPISEERRYYADFAMIPAYSSNLHRVTCVDLYGERAAAFFAAGSRPLQGVEKVYWRFDPSSSSPAQFSSMNFVLKWAAAENEVPDPIRSALALYFQFAYWVLPRIGYASNAHLIHSRDNISRIMKVAKSLYILRRIGEVHVERIAPYYLAEVQKAEMEVITGSGELRPFSAYLAKDVVEMLRSHEAGESGTLINGIVYEFKDKVARPSGGLGMLSVVEDFLPTDYDLYRTLLGLSVSELFQRNYGTLGDVGTMEEVERRVAFKYRRYVRNVEVGGTMLSRMERPLDYQIDSLFPVLVRDSGRVLFIHPVVLSALLKLRLASAIEKHDSETLITFVHLLQKMKTERPRRLRFTDEAEFFKRAGIDFAELLPVAYSAFCGIQLSRYMAEYF